MSGYNKCPSIHIENSDGKVFRGDDEILRCLRAELSGDQWTLIMETYPGANEGRVRRMLETLQPDLIVSARDILRDPEALKARLDCILTQDRVFGRMYSGELMDFADPEKVNRLRKQAAGSGGKNLVEGTACFVESADGSFDPFEVHYAETFIVPECVGKYRLRAVGGLIKVMQAYVRT